MKSNDLVELELDDLEQVGGGRSLDLMSINDRTRYLSYIDLLKKYKDAGPDVLNNPEVSKQIDEARSFFFYSASRFGVSAPADLLRF